MSKKMHHSKHHSKMDHHGKHHGHATHSVHGAKQAEGAAGSNLKFAKTSQAISVAPQKDHMAGNIGNHMGPKDQFGSGRKEMYSSGKGTKVNKGKY